jgi:DNA-binding MarR family transcriptional regulator
METSSESAHLGHWIKVVNHSMIVESNRILEPYDLTLSMWYVLYQIVAAGQLAQKKLQINLGIESGSMAITVDRLVRKGWIQRTKDERDRRANYLRLTGKGASRWKKVPDFVQMLREKMMKNVSNEDEPKAIQVLKMCWNNLNAAHVNE